MRFYSKRKRTPQIIIVSLIDIFAMLLIFFIVTTTFKTAQSTLSINLPESKTASQSDNPNEPVVLSVTKDEKIYLGDKHLASVEELAPALKDLQKTSPARKLMMNAAKEVSFGFLVQVLDALKEAGVKDLPTFTQTKQEK
jgi:biopolymer transport protein ExbD